MTPSATTITATASTSGRTALGMAGAAIAALLVTAGLFAGPALAAAAGVGAAGLAVQVCPAVRPVGYAIGGPANFTTLALPRVAVINAADSAVDIVEVRVELLRHGRVMAAREMDPQSLLNLTATSGAAGVCDARNSGRPTGAMAGVQQNQAVLLGGQVFGWTGERDALRIIVQSRRGAEDHREATTIALPAPAAA